MKAKSLHFSKSGSVQPIASELGRVYQCVCDQIPPAYPCEGEKVVFVGVEMNGKLPGPVGHFCKDLTPARAQNVAFYVLNGSGNTSGLDDITKALEGKGGHVVPDGKAVTVKSSLFKKGRPTDADVKAVVDWAQKVIDKDLK